MSQTRQLALNQPFEFEEALLSPVERSRVQKGQSARHLFEGENERLEVKDFRLRQLSIRLRTINNACDAMASLPGGLPLTEVSIYGSRDRQYLVGPYAAVKRLMSGWLPAKVSPFPDGGAYGNQKRAELDSAVMRVAGFIGQVESGQQVQQVYLGHLIQGTEPGRMVQLWKQDLEFLRMAHASLLALTQEFPRDPEIPKAPIHWWLDWSAPGDEHKEAVDGVISRARQVLDTLESQVFAPG